MKKVVHLVLTCFCLTVVNLSFAQTSGGPDPYGYRWRSSEDASGPDVKWIDITKREGSGAYNITEKFDDDNIFGPINFSFDLPYYWYNRNALFIGSNGYIGFQDNNLSATFPAIPEEGGQTDDYMAVFTSDLTLAGDGNPGQVWFYTDFKDTVVVSWINVPFFAPGTNYAGANTFQVVLSRGDSSITFNYLLQAGKDVSGGQKIGIENVNGKVGLSVPVGIITGTTEATAMAVRFYRPNSSTYKVLDAAILWNGNEKNGGEFYSLNSDPGNLTTMIENVGLEPIPGTPVAAKVFKSNNTVAAQSNKSSGDLEVGQKLLFNSGLKPPTNQEAVYRFETTIKATGDKASKNNTISQLLAVVNTGQSEYDLQYGQGGGGIIDWLGAVNGNAGLGVYIKPPVYPVLVTHVLAELGGTGSGIRIRVLDDNGKNLFGAFDGSPGDILYEEDYPLAASGENELEIATPFQINSGGIYIAVLQLAQGFAIRTETTAPHSYRVYEVFNGVWSYFRYRKSQDANIGIRVTKGDTTVVPDIGVTRIISPAHGQDITDSVQVKVKIRNFRNVAITDPFPVIYSASGREDVRETCNTPVPVGDSIEFTFAKKLQRPPAPKTQYDELCARTDMNNDFNLANNSTCIYTTNPTGVKPFGRELSWVNVFPNPAKDKVTLVYELSTNSDVVISLTDSKGRVISMNHFDESPAGVYTRTLDLAGLSHGLYVYKIQTSSGINAGRVAVMK